MSTKPPSGRGSVWTPFFRRFVDERSVDLRETRRLLDEVNAQWRASLWAEPKILEGATRVILSRLKRSKSIPAEFEEPIGEAVRELVRQQSLLLSSPDGLIVEEFSLKEQVALREFLRQRRDLIRDEERAAKLLGTAPVQAMEAIVDALPKQTRDGISLLEVPLVDALTKKPCDVIERIMAAFSDDDLDNSGLFSEVRTQFYINTCRASGVDPNDPDVNVKKITHPSMSPLPAAGLIRTYLGNTPFKELFERKTSLQIARERFNEHGAIFGRSGHGKTQALRSFCAQFLSDPDPPALFLIDSLGALIEGIDQLEVFSTTLKDRLVILDPSRSDYMPKLNFFDVKSDDLCFYLFKAIDQSFTPRQATMISYLMEYMGHVPERDLLKLVELCESKEDPYPDILPQLSPFARSFFENQFFAKKGADPFVAQTKAQIAQRLYSLGRLPKFNEMFSATEDVFDPYEHMQRKSVVLINTDARPPRAGGLGEASAIFGRYMLAQCLEAARIRPKHERHLALLVVDEAKAYMDDQAALILSDARQFGLGMLLASQQPHQLPEGVRREINTNTSIRMMGNIEYSIAAQYARDMFCEPEFILGMKKYDRSHAEWALFVSGMDHAVKVNIPYGAIERMPKQKAVRRPPVGGRLPLPRKTLPMPQRRPRRRLRDAMEPVDESPRPERESSDDSKAKPVDSGDPLLKPGKEWD